LNSVSFVLIGLYIDFDLNPIAFYETLCLPAKFVYAVRYEFLHLFSLSSDARLNKGGVFYNRNDLLNGIKLRFYKPLFNLNKLLHILY